MEQYPALKLIVERGNAIAIAIAAMPLLAAIALVALFSWHVLALVAGVVAAAVLYLLMRSYVELVRVMADMLIPK